MNDFEIQRRLRGLDTPRTPAADLWPGIAGRIATQPARARRGWLPFAAAAAVLAAVGAGGVLLALQRQAAAPVAATAPTLRMPHDLRDLARAPAGDPRLVGAAVVLDAAHSELEQALGQRPDAVFLVSLLNRTNAQRMKLDHFGASAG